MTDNTPHSSFSLANLSAKTFAHAVDTTFIFEAENHRLLTTLVQCTENPEAACPESTRTPFSLLFSADSDQENPILQAKHFHARLHGLEDGPVENISIQRIVRPKSLPKGSYFQVIFN